jgi:hypothetical protein
MSRPTEDDYNTTSSIVKARAAHRCDGFNCRGWISKGERYRRMVCFPGHDANGGTQPWVMRLCVTCRPIAADSCSGKDREGWRAVSGVGELIDAEADRPEPNDSVTAVCGRTFDDHETMLSHANDCEDCNYGETDRPLERDAALAEVDRLRADRDAYRTLYYTELERANSVKDDKPTIVDVVRVLRETYDDYGVVLYLKAMINGLRGPQPSFEKVAPIITPVEMIRTGRVAELYKFVQRIEGRS